MTASAPGPVLSANVCTQTDTRAVALGRFRLLRYFVTGLLGLMLVFAPAAPAQANLIDCVKAAMPLDDAAKAAELAAKVSACMGPVAGGDAVMAMTIATMAALAAAGQIPADTQGCQDAINSVIGKVLAKALVDAGLADTIRSLFGDVAADKLIELAQTGVGNLSDIPGLDVLLQAVNCGCIIIGAPGEAKKIVDDYLSSVDGCLDFFEDIGKQMLKWLEDIGCFFASLFGDCGEETDQCWDALSSMTGMENFYWFCKANATQCWEDCSLLNWGSRLCRGILCDAGQQCGGPQKDICVSCSAVDAGTPDSGHTITLPDGRCGCEPPYTANYMDTPGGKILTYCSCDTPNEYVGWACFCPQKQQLKEGKCVPCSSFEIYKAYPDHKCQPCPLGTKPDSAQTTCINLCNNDAGEIFENNVCKKCPYAAGATYVSGSLGSCCAAGQKPDDAHKTCVPACKDTQNFNLTTLTCKGCPMGQITDHPDPNSSLGTCKACPAGLTSLQNKCTCPLGKCPVADYVKTPMGDIIKSVKCSNQCPPLEVDKTLKLFCGPGMIPIGDAGCICPKSMEPKDGKCVPSLRKKLDIPVGPKIKRRGDTWLNPQPEPPMRRITCPPRMTPNAKGTACVPQLDMPGFEAAPGSLPGVGRGAPSSPTRR